MDGDIHRPQVVFASTFNDKIGSRHNALGGSEQIGLRNAVVVSIVGEAVRGHSSI